MSPTLRGVPERTECLIPFRTAGLFTEADLFATDALLRAIAAGDVPDTVVLGVALAIRAPRTGHVCVEIATAARLMASEGHETTATAPTWPDPERWLAELAACESVVSPPERASVAPRRPLVLEHGRLYLTRAWENERALAAQLTALSLDSGGPATDALRHTEGASADQIAAMHVMLDGRFAVLTGGPGTGKTTTIARVLMEMLTAPRAEGAPELQVALAAPTGKAAARLQEVLVKALATAGASTELAQRIEAAHAKTLHRLLGARPWHWEGTWTYHAGNQLPYDVVIIDEVSMVSLSLMERLVAALGVHTRLILVGDPDQLASVEAGTVLADIVGPADGARGSGVSTRVARLTTVHRFGDDSGIAELANAVRIGSKDEFFGHLAAHPNALRWIDPTSPTGTADLRALRHELGEHAQRVVALAEAGEGASALTELLRLRTLTAHREGEWGVSAWNAAIERQLERDENEAWYHGRPILITRNDPILGLMNGDIGVVALVDGHRQVAFPDGEHQIRAIAPARLEGVQTVHAMTIHKSQGSEFEHVVLVLPPGRSPLLTRELLYTGITRARTQLTIVGSAAALEIAIATPIQRASGLRERLHA